MTAYERCISDWSSDVCSSDLPPPWRSFPGWAIGKDRGGSIPSGRRACMKLGSGIAAVVTGGASGLGEATSRKLASVGVEVAIFDMNAERGEALAAELSGVFCPVDIRSDEQVAAAFEKARAAHGQERIRVDRKSVV